MNGFARTLVLTQGNSEMVMSVESNQAITLLLVWVELRFEIG